MFQRITFYPVFALATLLAFCILSSPAISSCTSVLEACGEDKPDDPVNPEDPTSYCEQDVQTCPSSPSSSNTKNCITSGSSQSKCGNQLDWDGSEWIDNGVNCGGPRRSANNCNN